MYYCSHQGRNWQKLKNVSVMLPQRCAAATTAASKTTSRLLFVPVVKVAMQFNHKAFHHNIPKHHK